MRTAVHPFLFVGCVELRQTLDMHALDERELMHRVAEVPADSVFFHTFGYFLRHRPFTTAYGNDFARWAALEIGDRALAERLAVVDPDRKSTRLNSSHGYISYAVFCLKKKKIYD